MAKIRITQVRSSISTKPDQRATLRALGLRGIRHQVVQDDTPAIRGMVNRVIHMVTVEAEK